MTQQQPDVEAAVKAALKTALPDLGGRVFYAVPSGNPALPLLTVAYVGGGPQEAEAPLEDARLTFSCWGKTKVDASDLRRALVGWLRSLASTPLNDDVVAHTASFINVVWAPDDEAALARYVVDATLTCAAR